MGKDKQDTNDGISVLTETWLPENQDEPAFLVVEDTTANGISQKVSKALTQGFELLGELGIKVFDDNRMSEIITVYRQTLIRK